MLGSSVGSKREDTVLSKGEGARESVRERTRLMVVCTYGGYSLRVQLTVGQMNCFGRGAASFRLFNGKDLGDRS